MTFDDLITASRAPKSFAKFVDCYRSAQIDGPIGVQSALPMRKFAPLMANITVMERERANQVTYRIAGENIVNRLGFNPTGKNFMDLLASTVQADAISTHDLMLDRPCGHYIIYENEYESGRSMISESFMLPMRKTETAPANLLLGYHAHHQATGSLAPQNHTSLIVRYAVNELVEIDPAIAKP